MSVTPLPSLDRTDPNFKTDVDTFFATELPTFSVEVEALRVEVLASESDAATSASTATTQAGIATTQAGIATTQAGIATTQAGIATTKASDAATSAASAANSPGTSATSTTSLTIGAGSQSLTIQTGKLFALGQTVVIARTSDPVVQMTGVIVSHNNVTGALSVMIPTNGFDGSGTFTDWTISLSAAKGEKGDTSSLIRVARSSNTMLNAADNGKYFVCTSTFVQTFDTPANLGNGWYCYIKNAGTGNISISTYDMYPGEERRFDCDGTTINSIVITPFFITRTSSGTFIKPPGYSAFGGLIWGAGASGRATRTWAAGTVAGGGGAAACTPIWYLSSYLSASTSFTIGAGGIAVSASSGSSTSGNDGGNSIFGKFTAYGGLAGTNTGVVSGAGILSKAFADTTYGTSIGGAPAGGHYRMVFEVRADPAPDSTYGGGGGGEIRSDTLATAITKGGNSVYGGAGSTGCYGNGTDFTTSATAGDSVYGGTAGQTVVAGASAAIISLNVGNSAFGGKGGLANAGTGVRVATAGAIPGGGGGAAVSTDNNTATSGAGGRGELQLWGII